MTVEEALATPSLLGSLGLAVAPSADRLTLELVAAARSASVQLGLNTQLIGPGDEPAESGSVLGIGTPRGFMSVFAAQPLRSPSQPRIAWVGEPLLPAGEPNGGPLAAAARSRAINYLRYPLRPLRRAPLPGPIARMRSLAIGQHERARNTRDLSRLVGLVDRLVVTSRDGAAVLAGYGIEADVVPFGYAAAVAGALTPAESGERDLPILSLASLDPRVAWRRSVLDQLRDEEPRLTTSEGIWGQDRNALLRRARVVLNVQRVPGNFVGLRIVLSLAAGAVMVGEPMTDPHPFVPGVHFVSAPLDRLLDEARALLADEPRRRRMAEAGQELLLGELSMANCLSRVLGA